MTSQGEQLVFPPSANNGITSNDQLAFPASAQQPYQVGITAVPSFPQGQIQPSFNYPQNVGYQMNPIPGVPDANVNPAIASFTNALNSNSNAQPQTVRSEDMFGQSGINK